MVPSLSQLSCESSVSVKGNPDRKKIGRSLEEILTNPGTTTFLLQQLGFVINLKRISDGSDNRIRIYRYENMLCENNHVLRKQSNLD